MSIIDIVTSIECRICFEQFIDLKGEDFDLFVERNKNNLPRKFEYDNRCLIYQDRFECLICKNKCCRGCVWSFAGLKIKPNDADDDITEEKINGIQGEDGPITCPFCRTNDYREYYYPRFCKIPEELLYEIKSRHFKCKKV